MTVLPPPPRPAPTAESVAIDYIDALWQSVSQVKTLKYESSIAIGRGGFSTVLKASWRGSTVAVKVLDPKKINGDVVDAIKSEVTAMTANRHPQIVTVLAASVQLPDASIIMEYCARGSLSDVLARARKSPGRLCRRVRLLMASDAAWPGLLALVRQPDCPPRHQHPEPAGDRGYAVEDRRLWAVQAGTIREGKGSQGDGRGRQGERGGTVSTRRDGVQAI